MRRALRAHPAFFPGLVGDGVLDRLDADGIVVDAQDARFLARRGADASGELGEVVGRVQHLDRALPVLAVNEIAPVGNDVVDPAAALAELDAASHSARALHAGSIIRQAQIELAIVLLARFGRFVRLLEPLVLEESSDFAHYAATFLWLASSPRARRYSFGKTLTNLPRCWAPVCRVSAARREPGERPWVAA